ncbi:MAG TPA: hemerythrin domain-containing protein [Caulobacteraceae bacterium]|nr:hemerythrin domain-containing protein [Caulobacteraceae bacterium]
MPTGTTPHRGTEPESARRAARSEDATKLLTSDHREVEKMFADYRKASGNARKQEIAAKICLALTVHARIEEEIFYPAAEESLAQKDEKLVEEAIVEHAAAKELIGEIEAMSPGEELYDAKIQVLCEQIEHHVDEEENQLFPKVRKTDADLAGLGARLAARKQELMAGKDGGRA